MSKHELATTRRQYYRMLETNGKLMVENKGLLKLLAEALEFMHDPDDYSPFEHTSLENKIDRVINPEVTPTSINEEDVSCQE